jgi:hypothetical protein
MELELHLGQLVGQLDSNKKSKQTKILNNNLFRIFFGIIFEIIFIHLYNLKSAMTKKYFYITLIFCLFSLVGLAQESKTQPNDALGFYPNPVSNGKIYITSKTTLEKEILIFDVLGKKVLQTTLTSKELNISTIPPGVYIIKISEGDATATRKLIIR